MGFDYGDVPKNLVHHVFIVLEQLAVAESSFNFKEISKAY